MSNSRFTAIPSTDAVVVLQHYDDPQMTGVLNILAPSNLPENYALEVTLRGEDYSYLVKVPAGGVKKGDVFASP
eukprot:CAMPEP_0116045724 /NCGR_PEP_ID=MMETSP0321-20121206/27794_1 /TAXON_ID=163516 /ORGANISM="Leptocylindrus danicus var. danicus, Strain B650" /LENGTH=73 /DNA_ID=CAMNT_0003527123 /DNA_START=297 /DNA_END=514 /DNA_ORIENTATION=-